MPDLYIPVQDDMTKLPGSTVSRGWQLFFQKLIQAVGGSTGGDTIVVHRASVSLTNADVMALPTTAIQVVAAPGDGFRVKAFSATFVTNFGLGAYTNIDASYCAFQVTNAAFQWITFPIVDDNTQVPSVGQMTHLLSASNLVTDLPAPSVICASTGAAGQQWVLANGINASGDTVANWNNAAVVINIDNNGSGDLTGGDPGNTATFNLYYTIEAL